MAQPHYHLKNRPDREITSEKEIFELLKNGKFVVLSMCKDNEPYIVTLSYGYDADNNTLYFHVSDKGLKLDIIQENSKVCGTIIEDGGYVKNECAHEFRSLVIRGKMLLVTSQAEKVHGMKVLLNHLEGDSEVINKMFTKAEAAMTSRMEILSLKISKIVGKKGR